MIPTDPNSGPLGPLSRVFGWAPPWLGGLTVVVCAAAAGVVAHALAAAVVRRLLRSRNEFWRHLVARTRDLTRIAFALAAVIAASPLAPFAHPQAVLLRRAS
jgi:hypothetical protein